MIIANNLYRSYNGKCVLNDVSLELSKGEISVLFGPSGCGKTTLCRHLTLLEYPDSGTIDIGNLKYSFPSKTNTLTRPYPKVNMVFQQLFLWPHLTNEQNIKLALNNYANSIDDHFKKLTEMLRIDTILNQYPNESSVGEKQRVAIARVLILEPEFVLFDEITSALDIVQTNNIVSLLLKMKSDGIGVLIITHNINFMEKIADNLLFMNEGSIIETGGKEMLRDPHTDLLKEFLGT